MSLSKERVLVCYEGRVSQRIRSTFEYSGFELAKLSRKEIKKHTKLRALILFKKSLIFLNRFIKSDLKQILDNGTHIIVVDDDVFSTVAELFSLPVIGRGLGLEEFDSRHLPISVIHTTHNAWTNQLLALCGKHTQLIPDNYIFNQTITFDANVVIDSSSIQLIRRVFEDCQAIHLSLLPKGLSSAKGPWKVNAESNGRWIDYVVKLDRETETRREIDGMRDLCSEKMAFPHYPPIIKERCLSNSTHRALVCAFVDRAVLFEDYIKTHSSKLAITAIFDGPLRIWRQNANKEFISFGEFAATNIFGESKYLHSETLKNAHDAALLQDQSVLSPEDILNKLRSTGLIYIYKTMSHGDLHLRNIFVRHHSSDIVLIDFNKCGKSFATADPATLDISLAFDIPDDDPYKAHFTRELLIDIYRAPLFGRQVNVERDCPRAEAIEAVRGHAITLCKELEYEINIAATLLWRAAKFSCETSYTCASNIAKGLYNEIFL